MNKYIKIIPLVMMLLSVLPSCTDDFTQPNPVDGVEGGDTRISLSLSAPDFTKRVSRADMDEDDAYNVQTLWIGIYNASLGKSTLGDTNSNGLFLNDGEHGFSAGKKSHIKYNITDIDTKSGNSYIVAVANPDRNTGYKMNADGTLGAETSLLTLLRGASTWDEFRSIVIERELFQNAANLELPNATVNPLPMSGIYVDDATNADVVDWTAVKPYYIPLSNTGVSLSGSIHLRRPYTQVKFNLSVDPVDGKNIVNIEPLSYAVHNVPTYGWLYERAQKGNNPTSVYDYANAGDPMNTDASNNKNYVSSLTYTSTDISTSNGVSSFDFWQMENKRTGIADFCTEYQKREVEYKNESLGGVNTGVYQSLCPTPDETLNNKATYVEIKCRLTYNDLNYVPDEITNPGDIKNRVVNATYIVHLGYVDGEATDFNNYRNSLYTYNVKVKSATNIIVEAFRNGENQPGAEGTVSDATDRMYELDSHYNVFNVQMSRQELDRFSFNMRAFYDGKEYVYGVDNNGNLVSGANPIPAKDSEEYRYYSWVEIMPTRGENVLAPYPGVGNAYTLGEIRNNSEALYNASNNGWFTVFVNEYTYEDETHNPGVETGGNWRKYVNQPDRLAYLNVGMQVSADGNSSYFLAKYGISQKSIQTYYDYVNAGAGESAIGVEYDNETYGMNLRWPVNSVALANGNGNYPAVPDTGLSVDNGRYNVWVRSGGGNGNWSVAGSWTTYVQAGDASNNVYGSGNAVNAISNTNQTGDEVGFSSAAKIYTVPQPVLLSPSAFTASSQNSNMARVNDYDPQTSARTAQIIHAMHACMNRNRDNNGDGVIDASELRWYLPASGKYIRVIMGRNSLRKPIMNYNDNSTLPFAASTGNNSRLHLASSDYRMVWADEGMSLSNFAVYGPSPWAVRCIRNLGVDMSMVTANPADDPVDPAYDATDLANTAGVIKVKHYYGSALRDYTAGVIPLHKVNSDNNKLGQYGFEIAPRGNRTTAQTAEASVSFDSNNPDAYVSAIDEATPCSSLNANSNRKGWRVPNQKELVIMMRAGIFGTDLTSVSFMSCTMESWTNTSPASIIGDDLSDHRICSITRNSVTGNNEGTARLYGEITRVRCVRDLTPAEADMSYDQIRQNQ